MLWLLQICVHGATSVEFQSALGSSSLIDKPWGNDVQYQCNALLGDVPSVPGFLVSTDFAKTAPDNYLENRFRMARIRKKRVWLRHRLHLFSKKRSHLSMICTHASDKWNWLLRARMAAALQIKAKVVIMCGNHLLSCSNPNWHDSKKGDKKLQLNCSLLRHV